MWVTRKERTIVAVLGGNTIAGLALSLLLKGVGYETIILKAPPDVSKDLLRDVNVLLVAPGLGDSRREESLTALGGVEGRLRIPVPAFTLAVEAELFRSLVEGMRDHAIFMLDPATRRIIQANTSLQDSLGYEAGELERLTSTTSSPMTGMRSTTTSGAFSKKVASLSERGSTGARMVP